MLALAALLSPPFSTLTYLLPAGFTPEFWRPGLRLAVPLGRSLRAALLLEAGDEIAGSSGAGEGGRAFALKEIIWPLERSPLLSPEYLDYARELALRQAQPLGRALAGMLPAGLRSAGARLRFFISGAEGIGDGKTGVRDMDLPRIREAGEEERLVLARCWQSGQGGVLRMRENADEELYALRILPPWPVRPSALRQIALLEFLEGRGFLSRRRILRELGAESAGLLKLLTERGLLEARREMPEEPEAGGEAAAWLRRYAPVLELPPAFALNGEQRAALEDLSALAGKTQPAVRLLHGITGSGKTAVYLELASRVLRQGRSVLLLAPEVALALKLKADVKERFPGLPVLLFHGYQTQAGREAVFRKTAGTEEPALIVGTRSALFLPLKNIGAIVLDEEHDSSFKQEERLSYQAKELAWFRAERQKALLVLGSATPDVKTFYAAEQGKIGLHTLKNRVGGGTLPLVGLIPMPRASGRGLMEESLRELKACVLRGEQAVILLNRRGFSPSMYCLACGSVPRCPNCAIALTYHKARERLLCHYCGHAAPFPSPCRECGSINYLPLGEGTEKLEEDLRLSLPPGRRVLRLDRDSTGRPGAMEDILQSFGRGEAEVLVGTQMLSKGHHFPQVTLVIVADGDLGLNMLDYTATERTFQLVMQAAGRAGRGEKPGRVLIQTRDPGHYCWEYVLKSDYAGFYRQELERRRKLLYPPFVCLALIRINYPVGRPGGEEALRRAGEKLQSAGKSLGVSVLGPAPAPFPVRERALRFQCLLKGLDWRSIRGVYNALALDPFFSSRLELSLDVDPVSSD
jgi:primosomal protein N' (replication factor Y)